MELIIHNQVSDLDIVHQTVDKVAAEWGFDDMETMRFNLVMEEAVSNVILYAYPRSENQEINILMSYDENPGTGGHILKIVIRDTGMEFDPTRQSSPDLEQSLEERRIGGLGIYLIKNYMDTVTYQRIDGFNVLSMTKVITKQ